MITSPTGRSVILIGGLYSYTTNDDDKWERGHSNSMIELAENSIKRIYANVNTY